MNNIDVQCLDAGQGWSCRVTVTDGGSRTEHEVTVSREELQRLAPGASAPSKLVEASFEYLLERESKESILRRFAISDVGRYFPGYPNEIGARLEN
jgi:hypothetical protein